MHRKEIGRNVCGENKRNICAIARHVDEDTKAGAENTSFNFENRLMGI